jgi:hypothetical protein
MHGIHNVRANVVNVGIAISVQSQKNEELRKRPNDIDVSLDNINSLDLLDAVNHSLTTSRLLTVRNITYSLFPKQIVGRAELALREGGR